MRILASLVPTIDEDRTDRSNYKVFAEFSGGETGGVINTQIPDEDQAIE
ncbi:MULTISPECIES: hypothetical protein [Proteiniphilum]|nr:MULTISPECIES: hypothetical protein [Proteiniphilum]